MIFSSKCTYAHGLGAIHINKYEIPVWVSISFGWFIKYETACSYCQPTADSTQSHCSSVLKLARTHSIPKILFSARLVFNTKLSAIWDFNTPAFYSFARMIMENKIRDKIQWKRGISVGTAHNSKQTKHISTVIAIHFSFHKQ